MKIKSIILDKTNKTTKFIGESEPTSMDIYNQIFAGKKFVPSKEVMDITCAEDDTYDPYVGVALGLAYDSFGSKAKFRKWVDSTCKVCFSKEQKKEAKKQRKEKAIAKEKYLKKQERMKKKD